MARSTDPVDVIVLGIAVVAAAYVAYLLRNSAAATPGGLVATSAPALPYMSTYQIGSDIGSPADILTGGMASSINDASAGLVQLWNSL